DDPKTIEWGVAVWTSTPEDLYRLEKAIRRARRSLDKKLTRKAAEYLESKIVFKNPERETWKPATLTAWTFTASTGCLSPRAPRRSWPTLVMSASTVWTVSSTLTTRRTSATSATTRTPKSPVSTQTASAATMSAALAKLPRLASAAG